jgi:hypothetical protein
MQILGAGMAKEWLGVFWALHVTPVQASFYFEF